jgi:hypothetical protein
MWQLFRWSSQFYLIEYLHAKSSRVLVPTLHIHYILLSAVPKQGQSRDWSIKWRPGPSPLPDYRISAFKIQPATTGLQTFSISQPPLMTWTRLPWPYILLCHVNGWHRETRACMGVVLVHHIEAIKHVFEQWHEGWPADQDTVLSPMLPRHPKRWWETNILDKLPRRQILVVQ